MNDRDHHVNVPYTWCLEHQLIQDEYMSQDRYDDSDWVKLVRASDYDRDLQEARSIVAAILHADERGQGLPFKEAMDRAQAFLVRMEGI